MAPPSASALLADSGFPCVGVPKTIDNDVVGTEMSVGFQTAVQEATSALDISDGLLADCGHIALASKVGIQVERDRLPLSKALVAFLGQPGAEHAALSGGDDYVLAFTLPSVELSRMVADGWPIHVVGRVVTGQGVVLLDAAGQDITPQTRGYQHFRETP